jgi:hypothetical protein
LNSVISDSRPSSVGRVPPSPSSTPSLPMSIFRTEVPAAVKVMPFQLSANQIEGNSKGILCTRWRSQPLTYRYRRHLQSSNRMQEPSCHHSTMNREQRAQQQCLYCIQHCKTSTPKCQ